MKQSEKPNSATSVGDRDTKFATVGDREFAAVLIRVCWLEINFSAHKKWMVLCLEVVKQLKRRTGLTDLDCVKYPLRA